MLRACLELQSSRLSIVIIFQVPVAPELSTANNSIGKRYVNLRGLRVTIQHFTGLVQLEWAFQGPLRQYVQRQ